MQLVLHISTQSRVLLFSYINFLMSALTPFVAEQTGAHRVGQARGRRHVGARARGRARGLHADESRPRRECQDGADHLLARHQRRRCRRGERVRWRWRPRVAVALSVSRVLGWPAVFVFGGVPLLFSVPIFCSFLLFSSNSHEEKTIKYHAQ